MKGCLTNYGFAMPVYKFNQIVETRENDGLELYVGNSFDMTGTFKFETQAEVTKKLNTIGLSAVNGLQTTYFHDYVFIS